MQQFEPIANAAVDPGGHANVVASAARALRHGSLSSRVAVLASQDGFATVFLLCIVAAGVLAAIALLAGLVSEDDSKSPDPGSCASRHGPSPPSVPHLGPGVPLAAFPAPGTAGTAAAMLPSTVVVFPDPRSEGGLLDVGVVAFRRVGRGEAWESRYASGCLGNAWDLGPDGLFVAPRDFGFARPFSNAEAAYQALSMWDIAEEFRTLEASQAQQLARDSVMAMDTNFAGYSGSWQAMLTVLRAKFRPGSVCAQGLLQTGDAFLIEHDGEQRLDRAYSGDGTNWLGLQLMILRDELRVLAADAAPAKTTWTEFAGEHCWIDLSTGGQFPSGGDTWQSAVRSATSALLISLTLLPTDTRENRLVDERFDAASSALDLDP